MLKVQCGNSLRAARGFDGARGLLNKRLGGARARVASGIATAEEAEACISSEFNPVRAGFRGGPDVWTRDVLNLGVRPDKIIATARPASLSRC